ncbi:MAG: hypothetical protein QOK15_401, partial [Nocardioidaceae bacterium]|nr:hypothetical protein [Nocardioidaceae bacterium]
MTQQLTGDSAESAYRTLEGVASTYTMYRSRSDHDIRVFRRPPPRADGRRNDGRLNL